MSSTHLFEIQVCANNLLQVNQLDLKTTVVNRESGKMKRSVRNLMILSAVTIINIFIYIYASGSNAFFWKSSTNSNKLQELNIRLNYGSLVKNNIVDPGPIYKNNIVDPGPIYKLNPENVVEVQKPILEVIETKKTDLTKEVHKEDEKKEISAEAVHIKPEVVKPDVVKPDVVKPDIVKPDVKPDIVKPDVVKPNDSSKNAIFQVDPELLALSQGHHIFPHNFNLVMNHPEACHNTDGSRKDIFLAVLILTVHKNFEQRKTIRETWASYNEIEGKKVITIFLLAKTEDKNLQVMVEEENKKYNDLIMEDFQDTYKNLTLKTMMGMKWASMYCPSAQFVLKTDDDMYVSYPNLVHYLASHPDARKGLAMGFLINGSPIRDPKSKWYMPRDIYPGGKYPPFLSGTGYVMSADVIRKTFIASVDMPFLYLEDVFCATVWDKIGVKPKRHAEFHNWRTAYSFCRYKRIMTTHMVQPAEMRRIWTDQKTRKTKCTW